MSLLGRLVGLAVVFTIALAIAAPYLHSLLLPIVVLLLLVYIGRLIWWYTSQ